MASPHASVPTKSRRAFLQQSTGLVAGAGLTAALAARAYAGENNTIKVALVGCGGRGTGAAAQALSTAGPTKLWAMADVFENRLATSLANLKKQRGSQIDVPPERQFIGLDGYRKAIDALGPGDVVLLTTPPTFRPMHLDYAVQKGRNVFMEKSFAIDGPGVRRVLRLGQEATKKNLKIAGGLMSRHSIALEQTIAQIRDNAIGDLVSFWAYRMHGPVGYHQRTPGTSELAHQIRNYSNFTWVNGSFFLDWLIHNLDICCWVKDGWPVSAQGHGGRQVRTEPDQLFDHHAVEYEFADGTRMMAQARGIAGCYGFWGNVVHGTKGTAVLGEGIPEPRIYKGYKQSPEHVIWKYQGGKYNPYQLEHDLFFAAIRNNKPYNEAERCAKAALVGILGRMAFESGKQITWDEALASNRELAPGLEQLTWESNPPVMPDKDGRYPIAMPGTTQVL